jgi:hypothetical protein
MAPSTNPTPRSEASHHHLHFGAAEKESRELGNSAFLRAFACHTADLGSNLFPCVDVANTELVTAPMLTRACSRANSPA